VGQTKLQATVRAAGLGLNGLTDRLEHSNTHVSTDDGQRFAHGASHIRAHPQLPRG
jgi:hypothetical protein